MFKKLLLSSVLSISLSGVSASAAVLSLSGNLSSDSQLNGIQPFDTSFSETFTFDDAFLDFGFIPDFGIDLSSPITVGSNTFQTDMRAQLFSNATFGIRLNLNGFIDGTTNLTQGQDDMRAFAASFGSLNLNDIVDSPLTLDWSSLAFTREGQPSFSQISLSGSVTMSITDVQPAAVPLPASAFSLITVVGGLGLIARNRRRTKPR